MAMPRPRRIVPEPRSNDLSQPMRATSARALRRVRRRAGRCRSHAVGRCATDSCGGIRPGRCRVRGRSGRYGSRRPIPIAARRNRATRRPACDWCKSRRNRSLTLSMSYGPGRGEAGFLRRRAGRYRHRRRRSRYTSQLRATMRPSLVDAAFDAERRRVLGDHVELLFHRQRDLDRPAHDHRAAPRPELQA